MSTSPYIPVDPRTCAASETSAPYWDALAEGRLVLPRCEACGEVFFFPRRWCPSCWSPEIGWIEASGRGVVYTACEVNVPFDGRPEDEVPYTVALIDLEEGVRLPGRLHPEHRGVAVGDHVTIEFGPEPQSTLPVWVADTAEVG